MAAKAHVGWHKTSRAHNRTKKSDCSLMTLIFYMHSNRGDCLELLIRNTFSFERFRQDTRSPYRKSSKQRHVPQTKPRAVRTTCRACEVSIIFLPATIVLETKKAVTKGKDSNLFFCFSPLLPAVDFLMWMT